MRFVLDSSVALSWCFEDEFTPATDQLLDEVAADGAVAPLLWPLEVLNALAVAERRGRLNSAQRLTLTKRLHELPVSLDAETADQAWTVGAELAARFSLSVYDATYLELAVRSHLPLATLDGALRRAAAVLHVPLRGLENDGRR